jgi:hypothetical protein
MARSNFIGWKGDDQMAKKKKEKLNPVGVMLTEEEKAALDQMARKLGSDITRHQLLQYAVRKLLADYKRGIRPELQTKTITALKLN